MALTTRAIVLQRLGLTDDATSYGAFLLTTSDGVTANYVIASDTLTLTDSGGANAFDLTDPDYDTLGELVAAVDALGSWGATIVGGVATSTPSALLNDVNSSMTPSTPVVLNYTNAASGTVSALIDNLITEVDLAVGRYCGRINAAGTAETFSSATYTDEAYDGSASPYLTLRNWPVASVSAVKVKYPDSGTQTIDTDTYRSDLRTGRVFRIETKQDWDWLPDSFDQANRNQPGYFRGLYPRWPAGFQNILVTYTAGYATIPADLQGVATEMVVELYLNRTQNPRVSSRSAGGQSFTFHGVDDLLKKYRARLYPYRNTTV